MSLDFEVDLVVVGLEEEDFGEGGVTEEVLLVAGVDGQPMEVVMTMVDTI